MADDDIHLLVLPASGAALLVWPDGRAVRVERDGVVTGCVDPPLVLAYCDISHHR